MSIMLNINKLSLGRKNLHLSSGASKVFKKKFTLNEGEKLDKAFQCYLSTTAGPIFGFLFISTHKVSFCSDRSIFKVSTPTGGLVKIHYKVSIPLIQIKKARESKDLNMASKKLYVEIVTVDNFDFWFMGFRNHQRAFEYHQQGSVEKHQYLKLLELQKKIVKRFKMRNPTTDQITYRIPVASGGRLGQTSMGAFEIPLDIASNLTSMIHQLRQQLTVQNDATTMLIDTVYRMQRGVATLQAGPSSSHQNIHSSIIQPVNSSLGPTTLSPIHPRIVHPDNLVVTTSLDMLTPSTGLTGSFNLNLDNTINHVATNLNAGSSVKAGFQNLPRFCAGGRLFQGLSSLHPASTS